MEETTDSYSSHDVEDEIAVKPPAGAWSSCPTEEDLHMSKRHVFQLLKHATAESLL
jgi:hypothetical protein